MPVENLRPSVHKGRLDVISKIILFKPAKGHAATCSTRIGKLQLFRPKKHDDTLII